MTEDPNKRPWLDDQAREFERALGQSVIAWYGVEMAIRDTGACPQFGDDEVDCIQLMHLAATVATGGVIVFTTYQDDDNFGLCIDTSDPISRGNWTGIYRTRNLTEFPIGAVENLRIHEEDDVRDEVLLTIAGHALLLVAAEICENNDGSLEWHRFDESVLAFTDVTAADSVNWLPRRDSTAARFK